MEPSRPRADVSGSDAGNGVADQSVLSAYPPPHRTRERYGLHVLLFVVTFVSTAFTGGQFVARLLAYEGSEPLFDLFGLPVTWGLIGDGFLFAFGLLFFLTVHEFGHYIAARRHGVDASLPYYIPAPLIGIGTLGAVIRIREPIPSLRKLFDIGAAGPLAGFVVALGLLLVAFATLPPPSFIMDFPGHEALKAFIEEHGRFPDAMLPGDPQLEGQRLVVGNTILYWLLAQLFPNVPPMHEMYHYPLLFAAWLGLFFTALNLLPVGQLDGGHITYALFGERWHRWLAQGFTLALLTSAAIGFVEDGPALIAASVPGLATHAVLVDRLAWFILAALLYPFLHRIFGGDQRFIAPSLLGVVLLAVVAEAVGPALTQFGYLGWAVWCVLLVFLVRIEHPPVAYRTPLSRRQRLLGYLSILLFVLCFSIKPLYFV